MSITKTNGLLLIRQYCNDTDTNNPGHTDAELTKIWNDVLQMVHPVTTERLVAVSNASAWASAFNQGVESSLSTPVFNDIRHVFRESDTNATLGDVMDRKDLGEILRLQRDQATQGTSKFYGLYRHAQTTLTGTVGLVRMFVWPIPSATSYFSVLHRPQPTEISGGTDTPDLNYNETYITIRLTASIAAMLLGRYELAGGIVDGIEKRWLDAAGLNQRVAKTRAGESLSG